MSNVASLDPENAEFLARLKEPPIPNSPILKVLIEILAEGGSMEDFRSWFFDGLNSTFYFFLQSVKDFEATRDKPIAFTFQRSVHPRAFKVPRQLLRELKAYLNKLRQRRDEYGNRFETARVLDLLPYWPYILLPFEIMIKRATSNSKGWNKKRWANTLRDLQAEDCPLGENAKRVAIWQYRIALAFADEFKDFPRQINGWRKRLKLPKSEKQGWAQIVKPLVDYLAPFFPAKRKGKPYNRMVRVALHHQKEAISRVTFQITANILHLAYPTFWPSANARSRVKNLYHGS